MNLKQFAKNAGVVIHDCDKSWGGPVGYRTKDSPNCSWNGYANDNAAHLAWLYGTFGEKAGCAILQLLQQTEDVKGVQNYE